MKFQLVLAYMSLLVWMVAGVTPPPPTTDYKGCTDTCDLGGYFAVYKYGQCANSGDCPHCVELPDKSRNVCSQCRPTKNDCPSRAVCEVRGLGNNNHICTKDSDCTQGDKKYCHVLNQHYFCTNCRNNNDCSEEEECVNLVYSGGCKRRLVHLPVPTSQQVQCKQDIDCDDGHQYCVTPGTTSSACATCRDNEDCPAAQQYCLDPGTNFAVCASCVSDEDCSPDKQCDNAECVPQPACNKDSDCPKGRKYCLNPATKSAVKSCLGNVGVALIHIRMNRSAQAAVAIQICLRLNQTLECLTHPAVCKGDSNCPRSQPYCLDAGQNYAVWFRMGPAGALLTHVCTFRRVTAVLTTKIVRPTASVLTLTKYLSVCLSRACANKTLTAHPAHSIAGTLPAVTTRIVWPMGRSVFLPEPPEYPGVLNAQIPQSPGMFSTKGFRDIHMRLPWVSFTFHRSFLLLPCYSTAVPI
ncbi:hypothetical protein C8F04DRAFT_1176443 [Mycena alexandri]|uniref:Uncharacterized protein n=1 Tax=Mycena alexandri TaxID=1745969 RepID=A0AAD6TAY4_9AGAR|nr:hypothetical protein C8F04DRAFT_1176443 [Mycena alexandri]